MPGWCRVWADLGGWCDRVCKHDLGDLVNGAACGGSPTRYVRCWHETPDPASTGCCRIRYAVANVSEGLLPDTVSLTDMGGGADGFAGNGQASASSRCSSYD